MPSEIETDDVFSALSSSSRRKLLFELAVCNSDQGDQLTLQMTNDPDVLTDSCDSVELYHCHLPYLDNMGIIDWNREEDTVSEGPLFPEVWPFIALLNEHQDVVPGKWP